MIEYLNLLKEIKEKGTWKDAAREGMPRTLSLFGAQMRFDLSKGFPILTTKKVNFKNIVTELLWFLKGDTNIKYLVDNGCNIWNEDAYNYLKKNTKEGEAIPSFEWFIQLIKDGNDKLGDCGKQYGWLWRHWGGRSLNPSFEDELLWGTKFLKGVDQIKELIEGLKKNPMGRRHIISAWNPATLDEMALNACHTFVQFNCRPLSGLERFSIQNNYIPKGVYNHVDLEDSHLYSKLDAMNIPKYKLDCHMYQRSADVFLGVPYNISSYSLLTEIIAKMCGMIPGDFIHSFGDVHIYENHMDQVEEQLTRTPHKLPELILGTHSSLGDEVYNDIDTFTQNVYIPMFTLKNYNPQAAIKAKLSTGLK